MKSTGLSNFRLECSRGLGFILEKGANIKKKCISNYMRKKKKKREGKFHANVND